MPKTLLDLLRQARVALGHQCGVPPHKNIGLSHPQDFCWDVIPIDGGICEHAGVPDRNRSYNDSCCVIHNRDTILLLPSAPTNQNVFGGGGGGGTVTKKSTRLARVVSGENRHSSLIDVLTWPVGTFHHHAGVSLVTKTDVLSIDIQHKNESFTVDEEPGQMTIQSLYTMVRINFFEILLVRYKQMSLAPLLSFKLSDILTNSEKKTLQIGTNLPLPDRPTLWCLL